MALTIEEVEHIAYLARLALTDQEKTLYREQLSAILDYVSSLQELDTIGISPISGVQPHQLNLREDLVEPGLTLPELLANSPEIEQNQFRIPAVFE